MPTPRSLRRSLRRPRVLAFTIVALAAVAAVAIAPAQAATLFSDGFESGTMSAWTTVKTAAGGVVGVQTTTVHGGTHAAQLSEAATSGSVAYARTDLTGDQTDLTATGAFQVTTEGAASANVPLFRFLDATGARAVSLYRQNQSGNHVWVKIGNGSAAVTTGLLPLNTWGVFSLHTVVNGAASTVAVTLNGATIYSTTTASMTSPIRTVQLGNDTSAQAFGIVVDDVQLDGAGGGGDTTAPDTSITGGPTDGSTVTTDSATFTFSSTESPATFQCSLDGAAYSSCSSPATYSGLSNASHTLAVEARDSAGNTDGSAATRTWIVNVPPNDTTPPDTTIMSGPTDGSTVSTASASFTFSASEPGSSFQCSLDSAAFTSCTSPADYTGLANSSHTFSVQATDSSNNTDLTPATRTWTVAVPAGDTTPPDTTITSGASGTVTSADQSFSFTSSETGSTFQCSLDAAPFTSCTSPVPYTGLANGSHTFRVQATDSSNNTDPTPATNTFNVSVPVDTTPPETTIDSGPTNTVTTGNAQFAFSSSETGSTFACSLDNSTFLSCTSPISYSGLANGPHTFAVQATDAANNTDASPAMQSWTVAVPTGGTFTFPAIADAYVNSSSPSANFGTAATVISDTSPLEQGFFKFTVTGLTGTVTSAKLHVYAVDATTNGPTVFGTSSSWTETGLTWTNKPATVGSATDDKGAITLGTFVDYDVTPLIGADGTYSFTTVAQSSDGFSAASREATTATQRPVLVITTSGGGGGDTTPPDTSITSGPTGTVTTGSASFSFSSTESGSAFACSLDAAAYTSCSSPTSYTGLTNGSHTFLVKATDGAGNTDPSPASRTWTVAIPASTPVNTTLPAINGTASQGSMLTADPGTWSNSPTNYAYQWRRCNATGASCTDIANATGTGYLTTAADVGSTLRVNVTASNSAGSATATSAATAKIVAAAADPVIAAAGDIACDPHDTKFNGGNGTNSTCRQKATGALLGSLGNLSAILPLGDVQYDCSPIDEYAQSFSPAWGTYKSLLRPAPGNHEYRVNPDEFGLNDCSTTAAGYYSYFGAAAGDPTKGYYSYDIGTWHLISLNANCDFIPCKAKSAQETWLKADLAAHSNMCTLAYYHQSRFSSGGSGNLSAYAPFWTDLYAGGADVVLSAHDHDYERFAPQDPAENPDPAHGIREFVVGTGGRSHSAFQTIMPNSEVRDSTAYGVLVLTLHPTGYDFRFVPEAGKTFTDSGSGSCHS